jgi:hypothetical protein
MGNLNYAVVSVESSWASKINWTALISFVAAVLSIWGIAFPPDAQDAVLKLIVAVSNAVTVLGPLFIIVFRTWFTKSVTPQSVPSDAPTTKVDNATQVAGLFSVSSASSAHDLR